MTRQPPQPRRSILRQSIAAVLLTETAAALLLIGLTATHEQHVRYRAFDMMLGGRANAMLGAVEDAEDPGDNVTLNVKGLDIPREDLFQVVADGNRLLRRSSGWPAQSLARLGQQTGPDRNQTALTVPIDGKPYRFIAQHGVRIVDAEHGSGGTAHPVTVVYGAPTSHLHHEVLEAVRFYTAAFGLVLLATTLLLARMLRRAFSPLHDLTVAARTISAKSWHFAAPGSARQTRELAPLAAAIEASVERLQASFEQQRRFTGDAAHELKTDVAIIKSTLQLLSMRPRSPQEYRQGLAAGLRDCERLEAAVLEMLTLARAEHAPSTSTGTGTDLAAHAAEAVRTLAAMAELHGVRLQLDGGTAAWVLLPPGDCGIVCLNLLRNALQHSPSASTVTVTVQARGGHAILSIQDQGKGIAPEALPHVFEPFYRSDDARDRDHGGTGLGLAISKALCEKAGGTITLRSAPGQGTLAMVRLPQAPAEVASEAASGTITGTRDLHPVESQ